MNPAGGRAKDKTRRGASSHIKKGKRKRKRKDAARPLRRRKLSTHPEAVRSRKRRRAQGRRHREEIGVRDQRRFEREEARAFALARKNNDDRALAVSWLEDIRDVVARVFRCSLSLAEAVSSSAEDEGLDLPDRQRENMRTRWLAIGRYEPQQSIGYYDLAHAFDLLRVDAILERDIHPQRLSQIRVVYADPNAIRGEGDSIVSKMGAWEYVLSELVREIGGVDDDDEESLAHRYQETTIPAFYIYFSAQIVSGRGNLFRWKLV